MAPARKKQRLDEVRSVSTTEKDDNESFIQPSSDTKTNGTDNKTEQASRSLFIRSLPASTTSESLADVFSEAFPVKHAVAVTDPSTKECRGYGFVTFADAEDAVKARDEFNGHSIDGKKIRVEIAEPRSRENGKNEAKVERERQRAEAQEPPKLIVRNLPWTIRRQDQLAALFQKYGKIKQAYIPTRTGGLLPGFGFVVMRSRKLAEKAIEGENGREIDGRTIAVDWAVKKEVYEKMVQEESKYDDAVGPGDDAADEDDAVAGDEDDETDIDEISDIDESDDEQVMNEEQLEQNKLEDRSATLFVRNLPFTCTDEDLEDHFSSFGNIRYARIVIDAATDRPKGTGFVCFRERSDADTCFRQAPSRIIAVRDADSKDTKKGNSILQNTDTDPSGKYTLDGRVLQVSRAVDKSEANRLTQEGIDHRYKRDKDKRRLYLLAEGTMNSKSELWQSLPPSEQKLREASLKQRKTLIENNPSLHLSLTRLSIRNIPRSVGSKDLKAMAREAVVGFAKDVKEGKRQRLSEEEIARGGEEMKAAEKERREAGKGVVKQAKVVFEGEGGGKVSEASGAGRSRGYGFIEYHTHRNALMGLRWLNGHSIGYKVKDPEAKQDRESLQDRKKRLIVEFAIENAQVVLRRHEREQKAKTRTKDESIDAQKNDKINKKQSQKKRKRDIVSKDEQAKPQTTAVDEKIAQRNRIIGRKRMRRNKRNQA